MRIFQGMLLVALLTVSTSASTRVLTAEFEVNAPIEKVWNAWTTPEGVKTFFAPDCNIEPRLGGSYEILFHADAKAGERGAEGTRILDMEPARRFVFTWNEPPTIPEIHDQQTIVVLEFHPVNANRTRVRFTQMGWGEGASWDQAYDYFDHGWNEAVLTRFRYAMEVGPIDWKNQPKLPPVAETLKANLVQR
jgi:uncharacterized protein YndB with AHSA1/START domain